MAEGWSRRWHKLELLGTGGQGEVHRVRDSEKAPRDEELVAQAQKSLQRLDSNIIDKKENLEAYKSFENIIQAILRRDDPTLCGALKILHKPEEARDRERAQERLAKEIEAMQSADHPNLLRILDASAGESLEDEKWYVSEYHPRGSLHKNPDPFVGDADARSVHCEALWKESGVYMIKGLFIVTLSRKTFSSRQMAGLCWAISDWCLCKMRS